MTAKTKYRNGQRINNLVLLDELNPNKDIRMGLFKCYCGKMFISRITSVSIGHTKSCGCYKLKRNSTHGLTKHPLYNVWHTIKTRCYNANHPSYKRYGGRGIRVCEEWLNSFTKFFNWCVSNGYKNGLYIEMKFKHGNYEPNNCRITTPVLNNQNRINVKLNKSKADNIRKDFNNNKIMFKDLAEKYSVSRSTISRLINNKIWVLK